MTDAWVIGDSYEPYIGRWSRLVAPRFLEWLALAVGLILLTVDAFRRALMPLPERLVVAASAVASFTWNTETASVWLLASWDRHVRGVLCRSGC